MQLETGRVQVAFNIYKYLGKTPRALHSDKKVYIFTLLDELFLCFFARRRGQCYIAPFTS